MRNFDEALDLTQSVKDLYQRRLGAQEMDDQFGLWDLYLLARINVSLIAYTKRRRGGPPADRYVSDLLASQYQFISGVFMIVRDMIENAHPQVTENMVMSAEALYDYADKFGIFESANGMVCAGAPRKILDFLTKLTAHGGPRETSLESGQTKIEALTDNPDQWFRYALLAVELDAVVTAEYFRRRAAQHPDRKRHFHQVAAIYSQLGEYCVARLGAEDYSTIASFEDAVLTRQNAILALLGWRPLTRIPDKAIDRRLA
ncbi:MAG: hypothetical protein AAGJ51_04415 [Pseudomonadota bacterium]